MADDDLQLNEYGDLTVDDNGDAALIEGNAALEQDLLHRLMTIKGSLAADPDYGASLPLFTHKATHRAGRAALRNACQVELAKESRILPQRTEVTVTATDRKTVSVRVVYVRKDNGQSGAVEATT